MRSGGLARAVGVAVITLALLAPVAVADSFFPTPATPQAEQIQNLFNIISGIALFVFVFVEALLIYVLWRFRKNKEVPVGETHRGHTKAEIAWTAVPAIILVFVGAMSAQLLDTLDTVPEDVDFAVGVDAFQFGFIFNYPNATADVAGASSYGTLYVEEGSKVELQITSKDVIHAVWIPEFGVKLDAVPGRVNTIWFEAPEVGDSEQEYHIQCAEYCGVGHHTMQAKVVVFPEGRGPGGLPYGEPEVTGDVKSGSATVDMRSSQYQPGTIRVTPGTTVTWVNRDSVQHTVTPIDKEKWGTEGSGDAPSEWMGEGDEYSFTFEEPGEYDYRCIPHSFQQDGAWQGMVGKVIVVDTGDGGGDGGNTTDDGSGPGSGGNNTAEA